MGLARFYDQRQSNGKPVSWDRAHIDGVPFRGSAPLMKEEEYQTKVERDNDGYVRAFRLWVPEEAKACEEIINGIANNWYRLIDRDKQYVPEHANWVVLIIWTIPFNTIHRRAGELCSIGS